MGSTEEPYELMVFGTAGKGSKGDAPYEHTTGRGWVKSKRGQYYDALHVKRCIVVLWLFERFGGMALQTRRALGNLARRSEGKNATDCTRYGQTRASPLGFYTHHMQQLSRAVVMYDARALAKQITCLKQELRGRAAQAAPAGVGGA